MVKKLIRCDTKKVMIIPLFLKVIVAIGTYLVEIYSANVVAEFCDAILSMSIDNLAGRIIELAFCVLLSIIVIPSLEIAWGMIMLNKSLAHDRIIINNFVQKKLPTILNYDIGELDYRIEYDPNNYRFNWMEIHAKVIIIPISLLVICYFSFCISVLYSCIILLIALIKVIWPFFLNKHIAETDLKTREYNTQLRTIELDIITNPVQMKVFALEKGMIKRHKLLFSHYYPMLVKAKLVQTLKNSLGSFTGNSFTIIVILIGAFFVAQGSIEVKYIAQFASYFAIYTLIFSDIESVITKLPIQKNLEDRMEFFYTDLEHEPKSILTGLSEFNGFIIKDLHFQISGNEVLHGVNLNIEAGDKVAVCGKNGSGKSTLLKILCGLFKDYQGSILLNNRELSQYSQSDMRPSRSLCKPP